MEYELTRYGEEYLETGPAKIDKMWERLPKETTKQGLTRLKPSSAWARLNKRINILESISRGRDPIESSFDFLKPGPRKTRAQGSFRKELASMLKENLVREVSTEESEVTITGPEGKALPTEEAESFVKKLQQGTFYVPQSRRRY